MQATSVDAQRAGSVGILLFGGGIALAGAILVRRDLVSLWWLAWAAYMVLVGALVLRRFRWSPELAASVFIIGVGYALLMLATRGPNRVALFIALAGTLGLLASYAPLRRAIRPRLREE